MEAERPAQREVIPVGVLIGVFIRWTVVLDAFMVVKRIWNMGIVDF